MIAVPASYKTAPLYRTFVVITFSLLLFLLSSGVLSFLRDSLSGTLGGLFPYFRPLNLTHEYALLSTSSLMQAYSGLSFNIGFTSSTLSLLESAIILILVLIILMTAIIYIVLARRKLIILLLELIVVIILSVPYANNLPIIGYLPLYIISSHTFTYIHYGEILSIFDSNRLLLFIYWSVFSAPITVEHEANRITKIATMGSTVVARTFNLLAKLFFERYPESLSKFTDETRKTAPTAIKAEKTDQYIKRSNLLESKIERISP